MNLTKKIEIDSSSIVTVRVYNGEQQVASRFWMYRVFFESDKSLEKRVATAHKWADKYINRMKDVVLT